MGKNHNNRSISFVARRYLAGKSRMGISRAHLLTIGGIALGVMALIVVSSVMNGMRNDIQKRIMGTLSEIRLSAHKGEPLDDYQALIDKINAVGYAASPVVRQELLIRSESGTATPAVAFGIDAKTHPQVSSVLISSRQNEDLQGIIAGALDSESFDEGGIILGAGIAADLGIFLDDEVLLISPIFSIPSPFGMLPHLHSLKVQAIFNAGMPEYDQNYVFIPLSVAQSFAGYSTEIDYLEIKSGDRSYSKKHLKKLSAMFKDYKLEDWGDFDASLYGAIRFEKYLMFVILLFMFVIAGFNLTGSLLKIITQKKPELGLLKALGYNERDLRQLFMMQAMMLCTLGIALGLILGSVMLFIQAKTGLVKLEDFMTLPVKIQFSDYLLVIAVSYLITWLSILLPLKQLSGIDAVKLIRKNA
ncbi:MAG: ABC transporter permease [Candidatus Cloacimonetes bacterium]|nr:ABC transporter permease [Candidatus Cloacimonadota bacterium]